MIPQNIIDKILEDASIVDVIGEFMTLNKRGINYMGCCPFHSEKTPSFCVSPTKKIYKCFSCGKSGNVISFLMEEENMTFREAVEWLGKKYNISIPVDKSIDADAELLAQKRKDAALIVCQAAQEWFHQQLQSSPMADEFLFKKRGMDIATARNFGAGYAPNSWSDLYDYLHGKGFSDEAIIDADVCRRNTKGKMNDTFRGRITFPFYNNRGQIVGFTARTILADEKVKYLNTGETILFNKGSQIFGMFQARHEVMRQDRIIMCEGQFDVMAMHRAGLKNVVCGSSTALTEKQRKTLFRFSHNITLCYDGDAAGRKGAVTHIPELLQEGFNVSVVLLPDGNDPDEFCRTEANMPVWFSNHTQSFVSFLLAELYLCTPDLGQRAKAVSYISNCIALCSDKFLRKEAIKALASETKMNIAEIKSDLRERQKKITREDIKANGFVGIEEASEIHPEDESENFITLTGDFEQFSEHLGSERMVYFTGEISQSDCQKLRTLSNTIFMANPIFEASVSGEGQQTAMLAMLFRMGFILQIESEDKAESFIDWYVGSYGSLIKEGNTTGDTVDIYVDRVAELISFANEASRTRSMEAWAKCLGLKAAQLKQIVKPYLTRRKDKRKAEQEQFDVDAEIMKIDTETLPSYVEDSEEYLRMYKRFGFYPLCNKKGVPVSYMFKTDGGSHTRISDFYMEPLLHIKAKEKDENKRVIKLNHLYFNFSIYVEWKSSVFSNMNTFNDMLVNEGCYNFENGTPAHFKKIWQCMSYKFQKCTELKVFGQQPEGFFAFSNAIIHEVDGDWRVDKTDNLGIVEHRGEKYYSPAFSEIYAGERHDSDQYEQDRHLVYTDTPESKRCTFAQWASLMDRVYKINDNGKWATIYAILCMFRSDIWPIDRIFTSVFLIGATQSGKTQIAISIRSLFIKPDAPSFNLNSGTDAAFFSILERFRDVPVVMEEYNDDTISAIKFQGLKSTVYDGEGKQKRKSATSNDIDTSKVNAPIVLLGQEAPQKDDNALTNRVIILEVPKHDYINDFEAQRIFNELKGYEKAGLSYLLFELMKLRPIIKSKFPGILKDCSYELMKRIGGNLKSGEQTRIVKTVSLFTAMVKLLEVHAPQLQLPFNYAQFLNIAESKVNAQVDLISRTDKLAQFFDTVQLMVDVKTAVYGRDLKIEQPGKVTLKGGDLVKLPSVATKVLYMNIRNIHAMYVKALSGDKPLTQTTLEVNLKNHPAFIGVVSNTRFKWTERKEVPTGPDNPVLKVIAEQYDKQTSAAVFNYDILRAYMDIDFEREKRSENLAPTLSEAISEPEDKQMKLPWE